jgi:hypothetical protein
VRYVKIIVDEGKCSLQFPKESKVLEHLGKYDFFGPINYMMQIKGVQLSKKYTTLSVVADTDDVKCLFISVDKIHRLPLWERPVIKKIYSEDSKKYADILYA